MRDDGGVTRIDDRGSPIVVDEAKRERLRRELDREGVAAAYLFGSQARGTATALSDVDLAVWAAPELTDEARFRLRLELMGVAARALGTDEVEVIVLDDAPPLLRHRVLRDGVRLVDRDPVTRVRGETAALVRYLDTKPLREMLAAGVRKSLAEGTFGRCRSTPEAQRSGG
jgi:uncharacterized protein